MSRIHEALKKAELERGGAAPVEVPAPAFHPHASGESSVEAPAPPFRPHASTVAPDPRSDSAVAVLTESRPLPPLEDGVLQMNDIVERCTHPQWTLDPKQNVFLEPTVTADGAEQFRTLRSRLYQMRHDQSLQNVLITSAMPGEGKTFVTSNLGQAIVRQHERRALIIDADLRRSNLHTSFRAPSAPGLTDYLRSEADLLSVIQQGPLGNLCFIPGGNMVTNPSELLGNGRLKVLLRRVAAAFDWVFIDSPPYLPVADANILADLCDGVLFVVRLRSTAAGAVEKASRALRGRNILGVIVNGVEEPGLGYHSPYGAGYQSSSEATPE